MCVHMSKQRTLCVQGFGRDAIQNFSFSSLSQMKLNLNYVKLACYYLCTWHQLKSSTSKYAKKSVSKQKDVILSFVHHKQ